MSRRAFLLVGFVVSVALAVAAVLWASTHPDGLEHVAATTGFADSRTSPGAARSGPLWDLAGLGLVLVLGGTLFWLLRRRRTEDAP